LNGPALNGPETKQDTIDSFFAAEGKSDQSDIDALFACPYVGGCESA
jgi:hypothetical protein